MILINNFKPDKIVIGKTLNKKSLLLNPTIL